MLERFEPGNYSRLLTSNSRFTSTAQYFFYTTTTNYLSLYNLNFTKLT